MISSAGSDEKASRSFEVSEIDDECMSKYECLEWNASK